MNTDPTQRPDRTSDCREPAGALPAPDVPVFSPERHRVLREHLMQEITRETTAPARRRPGRRTVLVAVPLALAAVVGLGVVAVDGSLGDGGDVTTATTGAPGRLEATELLDRIALAAAERPAVEVRDDQYVYTRAQGSTDVWPGPSKPVRNAQGKVTGLKTYEGQVEVEEWQPVKQGRSGLRRLTALKQDGSLDPSWTSDMTMFDGTAYLYLRQLQALPTDPDLLLAKLKNDPGVPEDRVAETVFGNVGVILDQATLLPDLSAALYRAMAQLPDVRVVEHAKDGAGREGIGLTYTGSGTGEGNPNNYWVFDRRTLAFLGTSESALLDVGVADKKGGATAD
ncbi:CU044_5270 family protein [Streptomyces sp. NPDC057620]|uniref:CU044_5270 family protein n=1 Tax=Streptomyces sp. NPDC057620 TaxID=3346185 RepID=UPI00369C9545